MPDGALVPDLVCEILAGGQKGQKPGMEHPCGLTQQIVCGLRDQRVGLGTLDRRGRTAVAQHLELEVHGEASLAARAGYI